MILDALSWLELDVDEGPISQVSRTDRHQEVLRDLLDRGLAYRSTATGDDVKAFKARHGADRGFRGEDEGEGAVRLRVPDEGATVVHDVIRGDTTFQHRHLDDPVIARADGSVLYNFAVAIDDADEGITHVIRGEDHLSNTPKQLLVLEAMGAEQPLYAHLPLLHGPDGKKLSKRHGAASVQELRDAGYLPEAVRNYLALLGWGDADDETVLTTPQLVERFAIDRVSRNPARFDEQKLRWLNGRHLRLLPEEELTRRLEAYTGRDRAAGRRWPSRARRSRRWPTSGRWPGTIFDGPADDPKARDKWLDDEGRAVLADARGARGRGRALPGGAGRGRPGRGRRPPAGPRSATSSRPCGSRSRARPSRRACPRRSSSSAATSRCAASTPRSRPPPSAPEDRRARPPAVRRPRPPPVAPGRRDARPMGGSGRARDGRSGGGRAQPNVHSCR